MASIIPITESYKINLIFQMQSCYAEKSTEYLEKIGRGENIDDCLEQLEYLSDGIYYLNSFDINTHEAKYLHEIKERAMKYCSFKESDLTQSQIENPILLENGGIMLTEGGLLFIQQEPII